MRTDTTGTDAALTDTAPTNTAPTNGTSIQRVNIQRVNILGVGVSAINMDLAVESIDGWIARNEKQYVCVTPVASVVDCLRSDDLRAIFNRAGLVTPDGMPLVWLGRRLGNPQMARVYGPDLMLAVCERAAQRGYRHFFYGGADGVAQELAETLKRRIPGTQVAGTLTPPFRPLTPEEDEAHVRAINESGAHIVWIGLGAPKQEFWMAAHRDRLNAPLLIGVGAAFDFHTGRKPQAPRWMQRSGLEWLFRLATEPRRLWKRYLIGNSIFLANLFLQLSGLRRYPLGPK
jgi:N-acetylglucosaminyldiphosphoundecaprenol N-acetyl-beta-D-mannosaminyltransferase